MSGRFQVSRLQTTKITYQGICGIPIPDLYGGYDYNFRFQEESPSSICNRTLETPIDHDAEGQLFQSIVIRHNKEIFAARSWVCQICGEPAKELYHSGLPFLSPRVGTSPASRPLFWDSVVPICRSAGECDRRAEQAAKDYVNNILRPEFPIPSATSCECCGRNIPVVEGPFHNVNRCGMFHNQGIAPPYASPLTGPSISGNAARHRKNALERKRIVHVDQNSVFAIREYRRVGEY
ncbi:hypothetical protein PAAG_11307 [Paracoccidioides lutzii Pb01]|uniref:Uncharacterized protein n=1 Tax=Paracoccidioides lutzii (strain ATCC MYA-826 / Pb01) TaxID=502779 RepID=A0A0A2V6D9_PARBA|nr:hypothetical protein PAAG_11307 [Paracoccidioides lutzii Pb01]KGQ01917.1 hypothetical protein PAAG_11307 [Paracoccidioides lutzii Pb01]